MEIAGPQMKTDAYTECRGVGRIAADVTETNRIWSRFISRQPWEVGDGRVKCLILLNFLISSQTEAVAYQAL